MRFIFITLLFTFGIADDSIARNIADSTTADEASRSRRWFHPHFVPVQFAGNIGFVSAGVGYQTRKQNYELAIVYGYVPARFGGVRVHSFTAKNTFPIIRIPIDKNRTAIPYGAIGLNVEVGGRSFLTLPDNMPAGYYDFPKSTHLIASLGFKYQHAVSHPSVRAVEFFTEVTSVDAYLWYKSLSDQVKWRQILSAAIGVNIFIRR